MTRSLAVVGGEALIDVVYAADGTVTELPGGGPFNAARTLARLGQPVGFMGRLSSDARGRRLRELLAGDGVAVDVAVATDAPTTLAHARLADGVATYEFDIEGTSAPGLTLAGATARMPVRVSAFMLGTLGLVYDPIATTLESLAAHMPDDTLVFVDPNCRPSAIRDPRAYRARLARVLRRADVVKVSAEDLAWLEPAGRPTDAARGLLAGGARVALVTLGGAGALVVTSRHAIPVPAPRIDVVDTIGAGDAFGGGFVAAWLRDGLGPHDLDDIDGVLRATRFACIVAARTCARAGADPPRSDELAHAAQA